jgi:hypothetical protein
VTCQQYKATNNECSEINTCENCSPSQGCFAQKEYPTIKISEYGRVVGDDNIMAEIYARGPVSAYINANCIEEYTGGIIILIIIIIIIIIIVIIIIIIIIIITPKVSTCMILVLQKNSTMQFN